MYENGADECYLTAVFTFASDSEHERAMRDQLVDRLLALANDLGHDVAVAHDAELPDEILLDGMSHVEPEPVQLVHRRDLKEGGRYTLSDGLEFTVLENNADGLWVENPEATNAGWLTDGGPFRLVAESEWAPSSGASGAQAGEASTEAAAEPFDRSDFEALVGNAGWGIRSRWSGVFLVDAHESEEAAWAALPEALATAVEFTFSGSGSRANDELGSFIWTTPLADLDPAFAGDAVAELVFDTLCGRGMPAGAALEAMRARYDYEPFGRLVDEVEGDYQYDDEKEV